MSPEVLPSLGLETKVCVESTEGRVYSRENLLNGMMESTCGRLWKLIVGFEEFCIPVVRHSHYLKNKNKLMKPQWNKLHKKQNSLLSTYYILLWPVLARLFTSIVFAWWKLLYDVRHYPSIPNIHIQWLHTDSLKLAIVGVFTAREFTHAANHV